MALAISSIPFLAFTSTLWISFSDTPSNLPEFIIILLLVEAGPSCIVPVQSCIFFGVMLHSHFTNVGYLSPKVGVQIHEWEPSNSSPFIQKQFHWPVLTENPYFLITFVFQGYHIINVTGLIELSVVTERQCASDLFFQ